MKKSLPVLGAGAPQHAGSCRGSAAGEATPTTREATPEGDRDVRKSGLERTVVRVEGMDCASCAATVEKRVRQLPGVQRATVNFAAGRLDAEHEPGLARGRIEQAVKDAGYAVAGTERVESAPFWGTPRAVSVFVFALLFVAGLALGLAGGAGLAPTGAYLAASSVGFAMGAAGTDVALQTADVALMQDDLAKLAEAVRLSRAAERVIKQNVAVSILVNGLFVMLAPFGFVTLWLAVLADMGTSIGVTLNGLRLFRKGSA